MDKSLLFSSLKLKNITLPGRIIRSATELFCADENAHTHSCEYTVFERLGEQPLGMIITGHTCISPEGRSNLWQNAIWGDEYIEENRRIAEAASRHGVPVIMQIGHGGMKAEGNNGELPVYTPDNMTEAQIRHVVTSFGDAALRAKQAGMNGVMLHGAHMYLLSQFFYPCYNHRTDGYGGSALNRFRIISEALEDVKQKCGEDYPVFLKINGDDKENSEAYHLDLVQALLSVQDRLEAVEISGWSSCRAGASCYPYFIENVCRLKNEIELPIIEVGGLRTAEHMLDAVKAGASAVTVARPLLCEPDFPTRLRNNDHAESKCIGCGFCGRPLDLKKQIRCPIAGIIK